jgi:hypothetical protein
MRQEFRAATTAVTCLRTLARTDVRARPGHAFYQDEAVGYAIAPPGPAVGIVLDFRRVPDAGVTIEDCRGGR